MKIAIITDGNSTLGLGHVYQSATLAYELSKKIDSQSIIFFITKSDQQIADRLSETGFKVYRYPDDSTILNFLIAEAPDRVIFDKLDVSPLLAKQIKEIIACKLVIFTNLTTANQYADMTVLADMGSNFRNVCDTNPKTGAVHFFGPKYWILRPEFYLYNKKSKKKLSYVRNLMLIFGGADQSNFTSAVLSELLKMPDLSFEIMAVVGAAFKHYAELDMVLKNNRNTRSKVRIVHNLKNVAYAMYNSDVVFASPGLSFFEALAVGTPVVGFHQNELQREVYSGFLTTIDKNDLFTLSSIIKNKSFIFPDDPFVFTMEIGQGKYELINEILK